MDREQLEKQIELANAQKVVLTKQYELQILSTNKRIADLTAQLQNVNA